MLCKSDPWLHPFVLSDHSALTSVSRLMWHQDLLFARTHTHTHTHTSVMAQARGQISLTTRSGIRLHYVPISFFTDRVSDRSCPSVRFNCELLDFDLAGTESRGQRSIQKFMCCTSVYCDVLWVFIDGRSSRFPCWRQQLRASAARRAEWRGRSRSPARVGVVTQPVWLWSSVEDSGVTSHRQPRQCRGQGPKTVKGAQSGPNYVSRLLARSDCLPGGAKIVVTLLVKGNFFLNKSVKKWTDFV